MTTIGTPLAKSATRVLLLGAGELGKEMAIAFQRLGVETVAADRYPNAPAMQVAHRGHVLDMQDGAALRHLIEAERPDFVVPEVEAIDTGTLVALESEGWHVAPTAEAVNVTMNRERIRKLATETLGVRTSPYRFAATEFACHQAVETVGTPCIVKPVMSSSGRGQSVVRDMTEVPVAWATAQAGTRGSADQVIVEGFLDFDYEITLLTVRHRDGTTFCEPIGHRQQDGDYQESWQPHPMPATTLDECQQIAERVTEALGGHGVFGVEFFVAGESVWFNEVSPRPHDTGLVTLISQDLSEFALHVRAILGLPITQVHLLGPSASAVVVARGESANVRFEDLDAALVAPRTDLRLFGKPDVHGERRMGVALAQRESVAAARLAAREVAGQVRVQV